MPKVFPIVKKGGGKITLGPDFGTKDTTVWAQLEFGPLDFSGAWSLHAGISLFSVDADWDAGVTGALDLSSVDLSGDLGVYGGVALADMRLDAVAAINAGISLFSVDPEWDAGAATALDLDSVDLTGSNTVNSALTHQITLNRVDTQGDAWIEQANPDTNHGSDTDMQVHSDNSFGNGEERALLKFDLTSYGDYTAAQSCELVFYAREEAPLGTVDLQAQLRKIASDPFDESTVTWNNAPSGTSVQTPVTTISDSSYNEQRISITASDMNEFLGQWLYVRLQQNNTIDTPQCFVESKEVTDSTHRPRLENLVLDPV